MITINFNKDFYNLKAAKSAIKAYKNLAGFELKENKKFIEVILKNPDKAFKKIIKDEFCNYVLAETKNVK